MNPMLRISLLLLWFLAGSVKTPDPIVARGVFGVRIAFQSNSQITMFVCFLNNGRTLSNKRIVSETEFINIASGNWPSIYNPERINYFEQRNLQCGMIIDTFSYKESTYCIPFDSLWKIRFSTYPYRSNLGEGWSSKLFRPSPKQELFLFNNYGVRNVDADFFLDSNFWNILSDVQDPVWVENYKALK